MELLQPYLDTIFQAVALAVVAFVVYALKALIAAATLYLQRKIGGQKMAELQMYANILVRAFRQSPAYENIEGAKLKELALSELDKYAKKINLPVTYETLDRIIEATVEIMKQELGEMWPYEPEVEK